MSLLQIDKLARPPLLGAADFTVMAGECIGIEGPSGSGKSMLLRAIADLDPAEGEIVLKGTRRRNTPAPVWRSKVCYVAAEPAWWSERVSDHFPDESEGARLAEALGLKGAMEWKVDRLSTGEGQRLSLARALACRPDVLLLDEPTSGLDNRAAALVVQQIRAFLDAGGAVILVAHDPALLDNLATRRYRMDGGILQEAV